MYMIIIRQLSMHLQHSVKPGWLTVFCIQNNIFTIDMRFMFFIMAQKQSRIHKWATQQ